MVFKEMLHCLSLRKCCIACLQDLQLRVLDLEAKRAMLADMTIGGPSAPPSV